MQAITSENDDTGRPILRVDQCRDLIGSDPERSGRSADDETNPGAALSTPHPCLPAVVRTGKWRAGGYA